MLNVYFNWSWVSKFSTLYRLVYDYLMILIIQPIQNPPYIQLAVHWITSVS